MILYNSIQTKKTTEKLFPAARKIANCNAYIIANPLKAHGKQRIKVTFYM